MSEWRVLRAELCIGELYVVKKHKFSLPVYPFEKNSAGYIGKLTLQNPVDVMVVVGELAPNGYVQVLTKFGPGWVLARDIKRML